jgi:hypothetical protein
VFIACANARHEDHGKKGKDADLKELKRPGIPHKDGYRAKNQQNNQTNANEYRCTPVCIGCRVIQPGIRANRYD